MLLELYFSDVIDMVFDSKGDEVSFEVLLRYLKRLTENSYVSKRLLLDHIGRILNMLLDFTEDRQKQSALIAISSAMSQYIHSEEVNQLNLEIILADRKNWFIPMFTMDLTYGRLDLKEQMPCYENCLRQILNYDDTVDIVVVFTITKDLETKLLETGSFSSRAIQETLAHHYGLPTVNIGEHLRVAVANAGGDWLKYTTDTVHPNDDGYIVCAEVMKTALAKMLDGETPDAIVHHEIPAQLSHETLLNGRMVELGEYTDTMQGFTFINKRFKRRFPYYYKADGIGSTIELSFKGTGFGIYWLMDKDSGCVSVTLDGKETVILSAWDPYCKSYSRAGYQFPFKGLEDTEHTVKICVVDQKDPESLGNAIAIHAFLFV